MLLQSFRSILAYLALLAAVLSLLPGMALVGAVAVGLAVLLGWQDMRRVPRVVFLLPSWPWCSRWAGTRA